MPRRAAERLAVSTLVAAAAYFVWILVQAGRIAQAPRSYDIYTYFYPIMVLTARAVLDGGVGLFWNPFQNCGQPLFGAGTTGILYPPAVGSLVLQYDHALWAVLFFNLAVGAVSAYLLCRELGVGTLAAWCGGIAFGFSLASIDNITFTPLVSGPYAWMPAAMLFCERILRAPTLGSAVGLGGTIALGLIPGHPQAVFYLYQLIALRFLWELGTRRGFPRLRTFGTLALGLALGPLFGAVQLVPYLEVMLASIRNAALNLEEIQPSGYMTWASMRHQLLLRSDFYNAFMLVPYVLASAAFLHAARRRFVTFYLLAGLLCVDLALGPNGYLFPWYVELPLGSLFRDPGRFLWVTLLCLAPLVAFGVDAITAPAGARPGLLRGAALFSLPVLASIGFARLAKGLYNWEWALALCAAAAALVIWVVPRARTLAALAIAAALFLSLVEWRPTPYRRLLPSGNALFARSDLYDVLRSWMTPQDRTYMSVPHSEHSLQWKTGSLFGVPTIYDYDAQPTRRYASFFAMLRNGGPLRNLNDWLYPLGGFLMPSLERRLLDLTAARYLIVDAGLDATAGLRPPPRLVLTDGPTRVYENTQALPRAFYVPRIELVGDPDALLRRLADGNDDLRRVAFVEADPPSGFRGEAAPAAPSSVEFALNDPEHLELRVHAPQRGFLFLADQYFEGWHATVNGAAAPIARANYAFRLVEVPAGDSVVVFRYRPRSVVIGAAVTLVTAIAVALALYRARRSPAAG